MQTLNRCLSCYSVCQHWQQLNVMMSEVRISKLKLLGSKWSWKQHEYSKISVISHTSVFRIGKNPIAAVLFARSMKLSVLSVLIGQSALRFLPTGGIGTSWLGVHASSSSWDRPVYSTATFPATASSQLKLDLKDKSNNNKIIKPEATAAMELLPNKFHATANVS